MAKRFTDTNKYKKRFIRGLQGPYKLLWDYIYHDCDHAGIWIVDFEVAQIYLGSDMPVTRDKAIIYFNDTEERVREIDEGMKWFIIPFIDFQYGELNPKNRVHQSVIKILSSNGLYDIKPLISPLQGVKDKDKDKDKDKVKDKDGFSVFQSSCTSYLGIKREALTEFEDFKKAIPDWVEKLDLLLPAIKSQQEWRVNADGAFRPSWKTFKAWLAGRHWEDVLTSESSDKDCIDCGATWTEGHKYTTEKRTGKQLFRCTVCANGRK